MMHNLYRICLATCLYLSTATAFYPYIPKSFDDSATKQRRLPSLSSSKTQRDSFTLPLRRVPVRRDNNYKIVESSDPSQENSVAIDQDGEDLSYMVSVKIGESEEEYHLLLDSAASNTWVMGEGCKSEACGTHNTFGSGDSGTLETDSTTFSITYGTGSVSGTIGTDTIHISTLSPSLTFGLASNVTSEFNAYPMDGILGLGRGSPTSSLTSLLSTLSSLDIPSLYGIHLSRSSSADGELNFGAPNTDRYDGDLNYISTVDNEGGFWEIGIEDAGAYSSPSSSLSLTSRTAILDTGTSFLLVPPSDADALHSLIPDSAQSSEGSETYTVPCASTQTLWIQFGGKRYNISTADYIGNEVSGSEGSGMCASNIIGRQTFAESQWLVGDVFLKNVYAVFDMDAGRVGLGVKGNGTGTEGDGETASASASASATGTGTVTTTGDGSSATVSETGTQGGAEPTAQSQESQGAATNGAVQLELLAGGVGIGMLFSLLRGFV